MSLIFKMHHQFNSSSGRRRKKKERNKEKKIHAPLNAHTFLFASSPQNLLLLQALCTHQGRCKIYVWSLFPIFPLSPTSASSPKPADPLLTGETVHECRSHCRLSSPSQHSALCGEHQQPLDLCLQLVPCHILCCHQPPQVFIMYIKARGVIFQKGINQIMSTLCLKLHNELPFP